MQIIQISSHTSIVQVSSGEIVMRLILPFLILMFLISGCGVLPNQPPRKGGSIGNPFGIEYYECAKCGSIDGGYYGKDGVSSWRNKDGTFCYHNWMPISKEEFDKKWKERAGDTNHF